MAKVLEGGVQRAGQRIRINAQLINVATDEHLWAETYDREMTIDNLFDIQSEITRQIVAAVKGQMSSRDEGALATAPTESVPAYESYLRARQVLGASGYNMEKYQEAQPLLERALDLDPGWFHDKVRDHTALLLMNWYPPAPDGSVRPGQLRRGAPQLSGLDP